ncbi:MAG: sn-glycerol-3-phosphate ABC transporter ATP-binding protein UgpC [Deltaproteobacteria bacterium]|nr:sn-glycerol-3-phosphate ABC transporter ATP-binding protein UgpC [Deltaproteobacteria bacterium]
MAQVVLQDVVKRFGATRVIERTSLDIADREFLVLVGPSGCGKSTLLRMIAGLEDVTEGTVAIGGRVVNDLPAKDRDIAMVFQNYALYPHMNVYQNMSFGLRMMHRPKDEIDARVREAARILELETLLERKPAQLSGGQRQRVAMGRAIVRKPKVFLFDEPLSNLDAKLRVQMRQEIKKLHERLQATIIYVTHDQVEAMTLATRIAIVNQGVIQQVAAPEHMYAHPANKFVAGFIGSPGMNFVDVTLRIADGACVAGAGSFSLTIPAPHEESWNGRRATLGIRPEHIAMAAANGMQAPVRVRVELVEPLGATHLVTARAGEHALAFLTPSGGQVAPHTEIDIHLNTSEIKLFDAETGAGFRI